MNTAIPGLSIKISDDVKKIRSSVIVANHRSYLDPILLISIFPKQKSIVKGIFFKVPVMSRAMKAGGYIPLMQGTAYNDIMIESIKNISDYLKGGGNIFIFPEGKRSRDGRMGKFQKGAFSIACKFKLPVQVIYIHNTGRLFAPGKFFLNTCIMNAISVEKLGTIEPLEITAGEMREKAVRLYEERMERDLP